MIVVDTNVVAYLFLGPQYTARAEALWSSDPDWLAPRLWRSEFRNLLAGYLRRGALSYEGATRIQEAAEELLAGNELDVPSSRVLSLVRDSDCSAYDCEFVAVALETGCKLVTMDSRLLRAFPSVCSPLPAL